MTTKAPTPTKLRQAAGNGQLARIFGDHVTDEHLRRAKRRGEVSEWLDDLGLGELGPEHVDALREAADKRPGDRALGAIIGRVDANARREATRADREREAETRRAARESFIAAERALEDFTRAEAVALLEQMDACPGTAAGGSERDPHRLTAGYLQFAGPFKWTCRRCGASGDLRAQALARRGFGDGD